MSSPLKLLFLYTAWDQKNLGVLTCQAPDSNGNITTVSQYIARIGTDSFAAPLAVWDSANGVVRMLLNIQYMPFWSFASVSMCTLRSGGVLGSINPIIDAGTDHVMTSIVETQNNIYGCWAWSKGSNIYISCRDQNWTNTGDWRVASLPQFWTASGPVLLRVASDWVYIFHINKDNTDAIYFPAINPGGLNGILFQPSSKVSYNWSGFYCKFSYNLAGRPVPVLTGSTSTNRKVHVFILNMKMELRYFNFKLGANGLPDNYNTADFKVTPSDETRVGTDNFIGPVSAFTYGKKLYAFGTVGTDKNNLRGWSRDVDSTGSWNRVSFSGNLVSSMQVHTNQMNGGVVPVLVQEDF